MIVFKNKFDHLLLTLCAVTIFSTTLADTVADDTHTVTLDNAIVPVDVTDNNGAPESLLLGVTLTELDLSKIRLQADASGEKYVTIATGQICVGSNDKTGMPISLAITELVAVDTVTNPDTAHLLLAIFSAAGNYADSAAYSEIGGTAKVVYATTETNFPTSFYTYDRGPHIRGTQSNSTTSFEAISGYSWPNDAVTSSEYFSNGSFIKLVHFGITPFQDVTYSTNLSHGVVRANGFENVKIVGCESALTMILFIKADDGIDLRAGSYETTITIVAQADD